MAVTEGRGTHFDTDILDAYLAHQKRCKATATRFTDAGEAPHGPLGAARGPVTSPAFSGRSA